VQRCCAAASQPFSYTTLFRSAAGGDGLRRRVPLMDADARQFPGTQGGAQAQKKYAGYDELSSHNPFRKSHSSSGPMRRKLIIARSEEHTSELQSHLNLVCRLL